MTDIKVERLKIVVRNPTRSVYQCGIATILLLFVAAFYLWIAATHKTDYFSIEQPSNVIACKNFKTVLNNGKVEFSIYFENYYPQDDTVIGKIPMENNEEIVLMGNEAVWHGTYDVNEKQHSNALMYFQKGMDFDESTIRHYYNISCPHFLGALHDITHNWNPHDMEDRKQLDSVHNETIPEQQTTDLNCYEFEIQPLSGNDRLDVKILVKNPYFKEDVEVAKYPMNENETVVMQGNDIIWYASFRPAYRQRFQPSILVFRNHDGSIQHLYNFTCQGLNIQLDKYVEDWWNIRHCFENYIIITTFFTFLLFGCVVGLMSGEYIAKKNTRTVVILSTPRIIM